MILERWNRRGRYRDDQRGLNPHCVDPDTLVTNGVHGNSCREIDDTLALGKQKTVVGLAYERQLRWVWGNLILVGEEWTAPERIEKEESSCASEVVVRGCPAGRWLSDG
jgi:hypothetical protein